MNMYLFEITHDSGTTIVKTTGSSKEEARKKITTIENCPPRAVKLIKTTVIGETHARN